jgi:hypothetical protein
VYDPKAVEVKAMLAAIADAGFTGTAVDPPAPATESKAVSVDVAALPQRVREAFQRAKERGRLVLVDVHGPG